MAAKQCTRVRLKVQGPMAASLAGRQTAGPSHDPGNLLRCFLVNHIINRFCTSSVTLYQRVHPFITCLQLIVLYCVLQSTVQPDSHRSIPTQLLPIGLTLLLTSRQSQPGGSSERLPHNSQSGKQRYACGCHRMWTTARQQLILQLQALLSGIPECARL